MINIYAYTYESAVIKQDGFIITKIGDSIREVEVRMAEQGGAAEWEQKIEVGRWNNCKNIYRDYAIHKVLRQRALHVQHGAGTEWFKIPANTVEEAYEYIDAIIKDLEGERVRDNVKLRALQQQKLDEAMAIIDKGEASADVIANLCPRFGKTIWSLMLFNEVTKKYGNNVMLLPAYVLAVHTSFKGELGKFKDFEDIVEVTNEQDYQHAIASGLRVVIPLSLCGEFGTWSVKNEWVSKIDNNKMFVFADEGDFGTHADNQVEKMNFLFA